MNFLKRKKAASVPVVPAEPKKERLDNGELPWGWYSQNECILKVFEDEITRMAVELKSCKGIDRIVFLERLVRHYYEYKEFCYKKNECYKKYFQDMWEHCHNSRCKDFEYIKPFEDELKTLKGLE